MEFMVLRNQRTGASLTDENGIPYTHQQWLGIRAAVDTYFATNPTIDVEARLEELRTLHTRQAQRQESATQAGSRHRGVVYLIRGEGTPWHKIGRTTKPVTRLKAIGSKTPFVCTLLRTFAVEDAVAAEKNLHALFADKRADGEWFELSPQDVRWLMTTQDTTFSSYFPAAVHP